MRSLKMRMAFTRDDAGIAMVMVIAITSVLAILMVAAVSFSLGSLKQSRSDQDWNAALAAAYSGIEEYQSRLADDPNYKRFGNPDSEFTNPTHAMDPGVDLPTGSAENKAFGIDASGTWAEVAGSDGAAHFRYEVDVSEYNGTGIIKLRSTGRVGDQTRSLVAKLRQTGFIDFLYFTDYEIGDPEITKDNDCLPLKYQWQGRDSDCSRIRFADGDYIGGPVHTNDKIYSCGATFADKVITAAPSGGIDKPTGCSGNASFKPGYPAVGSILPMPSTNKELAKFTRTDLPDEVPEPGCLYTGPTEITLVGGGKMKVKSPWTKFTNVKGDDLKIGVNRAGNPCGNPATLKNGSEVTVDIPANNVVYVQNIPDDSTNSNYSSTGSTTDGSYCRNAHNSSRVPKAGSSTRNIVGYPKHNDEVVPTNGVGEDASYGCRNGDLFIQGTLDGTTATFGAEHYVYITEDIRYANPDKDMLGLIGLNAVWVWNPMRCPSGCGNATTYTALVPEDGGGRQIDAAILSVAHTFMVQNYNLDDDSRGELRVYGAIAQKFRGAVGSTYSYSNGSFAYQTGYDKNYIYDTRFQYMAPPRFLSPVTSTYGVTVWVEISPVFKADGS